MMILRADELMPGMLCTFEDFEFTVKRVNEGFTENWVEIVPVNGVPMPVENYEKIQVDFIPHWVDFDPNSVLGY